MYHNKISMKKILEMGKFLEIEKMKKILEMGEKTLNDVRTQNVT